MKNLARRGLRPLKRLAGPVIRRLHFRVVYWTHEATDARFENLERQVLANSADVAGLERYVPAILNAIQSQNAMNRANVRTEEQLSQLVQSVLERFQTVRNELLYAQEGRRLEPLSEPKVLHPERLEAAGRDLRLNLGCANTARPGYVNVDGQPFDAVDVLADPRDLPFDPQSVAEIRAAHLLERFSLQEVENALLPHWVSLLAPGGSLVAVVPDADAMVRAYVAGVLSFEELRDSTFGDRGEGSDIRFTMFSPAVITQLLVDAGLDDVVVRHPDPVTPTREIEVVGRKPSSAPLA
jgi:hypothetical protein